MEQKTFNEMVRPCTVKGHKAAFHRWVEHSYVEAPGIMTGSSNGGQVTYLKALVEFETGELVEVLPKDIVFRDFCVNRMWSERAILSDDAYEDWLKAHYEASLKKESEKSQ